MHDSWIYLYVVQSKLNPFESIIRGLVQDRITRGKVEVSVSIQDAGERPKTLL